MIDDLPAEASTFAGDRVIRIEAHHGLIRGQIKVGLSRDGRPLMATRYWYPDGRLSAAIPSIHDLILDPDALTGSADDQLPGTVDIWRGHAKTLSGRTATAIIIDDPGDPDALFDDPDDLPF